MTFIANGRTISVRYADTLWKRIRGLLGHSAPPFGCGLLLPKTRSVHTVGMSYPIDVLFLDQEYKVLRLAVSVRPGRFYVGCRGAEHVLEMRGSAAAAAGITEGTVFQKA